MPIDREKARNLLKNAELRRLFIEELGWDHHQATFEVPFGNRCYTLTALAQKRGMVAFHCPTPYGERLPDHSARRKIEQSVTRAAHEHLIIFTDGDHQIWQWVRREPGKPLACREHHYHSSQPGDTLLQKLEAIAFSLEEEELITLPDVTGRVRAAFDVERVTRRFYEEFRRQHAAFLKFIEGIPVEEDRAWYASVMLNRLMFLYFIQKKGFLDGDPDYLRNRLRYIKEREGKDRFYGFYRNFLLRLFHEGLCKKKRTPELEALIGRVPHLNGGIFDAHPLEQPERYGKEIQIPDEAFERIFDYFDRYRWHLDERPLRADNEINPDVLGYIFEKYVNQKQMGAYYTKEDITEYIGKNTLIPFLLDAARLRCRIAFDNPDGPTVWDLLRSNPDRYLYPAVKHGVIRQDGTIVPETELPDFVRVGMHDPKARMFDKRYNLEQAEAGDPIRLVTETWREYVYRRNRCLEIRQKLQSGEVRQINDLITLNLDIRQFAQDVIETCEGPDLLRAFWHALENITVLDPTCGSGAFLFAALNILEPLYEACLERMEAFIQDLERSGVKHRPEKYADFRRVLERVAAHPNRRYFIFKSIILKNLYGVDIMEEAVEICKLRLFLKLAAQVEPDPSHPNLGVEPLPDIDFNIRAGNTLVGYATYADAERAVTARIDFDNTLERIRTKAADLQQAFEAFRARQMDGDESVPFEDKTELHRRLSALNEELNRYLASEYGIDPSNKEAYDRWLKTHQPFHWFVEFYGIVHDRGGFDVIIGNPPYVEYNKVRGQYTIRGYQTEECGNLYAFIVERNRILLAKTGYSGMIIPHSAFCTDRMQKLMAFFHGKNISWISNYSIRPAKLFDGVDQRLAIYIQGPASKNQIFSTKYHHWYEEFRPLLFAQLQYVPLNGINYNNSIPKLNFFIEISIWDKLTNGTRLLGEVLRGYFAIYFHNAPRYWIRAMDFAPYFWNERDGEQISSQVKKLFLTQGVDAAVVVAVLNSSLFYWWFLIVSDCRHLNMREIENFPLGLARMYDTVKAELMALTRLLIEDFNHHKERKECYYKATGRVVYDEFYPKYSKPIIDKIDQVLARHYGFTDEELDFIINYDIKYRMGRDAGEDQEGE